MPRSAPFANVLAYKIPLQWHVVVVSLTDIMWASILSSSIGDGFNDASSSSTGEETEAKDLESITKAITRANNIEYSPVE